MTELPEDRSQLRPWLIFESEGRWLNACRRFAPNLMPADLVAQVRHFEPPVTGTLLAGQRHAVVIWETDRTNFTAVCEWLAETRLRWPSVLMLAAVGGLADRQHLVLSELGAATLFSHPEHLSRLAGMIPKYFGSSA